MGFKEELDTAFFNYDNRVDWIKFSQSLSKTIENHSQKPIDPGLIYQCLSFSDKNSQSFLRTLSAKLLKKNVPGTKEFMKLFIFHYPNYLDGEHLQ